MPNCPLSREPRLFSAHFCRSALFALLIAGALFVSGNSTAANAQATPASNTPAANKPASDTANDGQPIAYSHRLHAGDLQIQCVYCHTGVKRSAVAGVPAVGTCTGCHRWVKNKTAEMKKIDDYEQRKQPIFWK